MEAAQQTSFSNMLRPINDYNMLKLRLDTTALIDKIELFLRGAVIQYVENAEGKTEGVRVPIGTPKCNDRGVQSIIQWVDMNVNPLTIQGNFYVNPGNNYSQKYEDFLYWFRIDLIDDITKNIYFWDISDEDIEGIVDKVCDLVELTLSRLLDNKERESYSETVKSTENNTMQNGGGIKLPFNL